MLHSIGTLESNTLLSRISFKLFFKSLSRCRRESTVLKLEPFAAVLWTALVTAFLFQKREHADARERDAWCVWQLG